MRYCRAMNQSADLPGEMSIFATDHQGRRVLRGLTVEETAWYLHHIALDNLRTEDRDRFIRLRDRHETAKSGSSTADNSRRINFL